MEKFVDEKNDSFFSGMSKTTKIILGCLFVLFIILLIYLFFRKTPEGGKNSINIGRNNDNNFEVSNDALSMDPVYHRILGYSF